MKRILLFNLLLLSKLSLQAQLFSQNFNGTTDYNTLVSSTPSSSQFNAIGTAGAATTVSIDNSTLKYVRTTASTASGSFTRSANFSPTPEIIIYKFDIQITGNTSSQTSAAVFQVGTGFSPGSNSPAPITDVHSRFSINMNTTPGEFTVRDIGNSLNGTGAYSGIKTITWVINNSSTSYIYTPPNGIGLETVAAGTWDLFVENTKELDNRPAETETIPLNNLKFAFISGIGSIAIDNINIEAVTALPITLSKFIIKPINKTILLNWETSSEIKNDYFDIERSTDGKSFAKIGKQAGSGNSNTLKIYSFTDHHPLSGTNYYRLVQYDFDGKSTPSEVKAVNALIDATQVYVTPQEDRVDINIFSPNTANAKLFLVDIAGRKIGEQSIILSKGSNQFSFPATCNAGIYFVNLLTEGSLINTKFIK